MEFFRSRQRVNDHGEVFTPAWIVDSILDLVKHESERVDSRFLEPACGSGNFLAAVLTRKLRTVERLYGKHPFERQCYALLSLMCIYGIELLADNVEECREKLLAIFLRFLGIMDSTVIHQAAAFVVKTNIVHGDALTITTLAGDAITFPEWAYLGRGKFQRRDFRYDSLTHARAFADNRSLFSRYDHHDIFQPVKHYPSLDFAGIARG